MNKKSLLITSAIISLSLVNVGVVKAEETFIEPQTQNEQIEKNENKNSEEHTSNSSQSEDDNELQKDNTEETQEKYTEIFKELHTILNDEQKELIEIIYYDEGKISSIFKETIVLHQDKEYKDAVVHYEELLVALSEKDESFALNNSSENEFLMRSTELVKLFKQSAEDKLSLLAYDYAEAPQLERQEEKEDKFDGEEITKEKTEKVSDEISEDTDALEKEQSASQTATEESPLIIPAENEQVLSEMIVNYRGYLASSLDTIYSKPTDSPEFEAHKVGNLQGQEVKVLEEVETSHGMWLRIDVVGTNVSGWIDQTGINTEEITSQKDVNYRGYLARSHDTLNTQPWGTPGYEELRRVEDLQGQEVKILQESQTQRATWLYVEVVGANIAGWIDQAGIDIETISSQKQVNYRGYLARPNDTINTQPWGTPGYEELRRVEDLQGREVKILQEAQTQRATWLYVEVVGSNVAGWVDQVGIDIETISSQQDVNYRGYLARPNDTINTQPWGTPGYEEIRRVEDLQGREVKVLQEAQTQRATWLYIDIVGANISGWIDQAGIDVEAISSQKEVNYRAYLSRSSDSINTQPWGTPGNGVIRQVDDFRGKEVEVLKEAETQRATWAFVNVLGTSISGWIDTAGLGSHLIYIDPGHGGSDTGATSGGVQEKDLNLTLSKKVRDILENKGYAVVMSREIDEFPSLSDRAQEANNIGADIFVSIHHNSFDGAANGIETFYYNENGNTNNPLANDKDRIENSKLLAESIQQELINETGANNRGVKRANFHVVRETKMPAVLVEGGFIDNTIERAKLVLDSYQQKLADAISTGIDKILSNWF